MRILLRTSKWAVWSRRIGALALPLAAIPILLHREHIITSENFITIEAIALGLAALAVFSAGIAFVRLWFTGDRGWWRASVAFIFGALCLAPAGYFAFEYLHSPSFPDVSTDFSNPPPLVSFVEARFIGPSQRAEVEARFPNARSRSYPITAPQMFDTVAALLDDRGWDVRARREPQNELDSGQFNAVITTLQVDRKLEGPDGLRPLGPHRFVQAEGTSGRITTVTIDGDKATIGVLREGLNSSPGVTVVGNTVFAIEGKIGYLANPALRGQDPGEFKIYAIPLK